MADTGSAGGHADGVAFNHVGLCVTDLDRARRFYEQALGFRSWWELDAPEEGSSVLLQLPSPVSLHAAYLIRDGLVLELLHYGAGEHPPWRRRSMDEPGLTHLSLSVRDLRQTLEWVRKLGGSVLEETNIQQAVMVRDPDGQLIELTSWDWRSVLPPMP